MIFELRRSGLFFNQEDSKTNRASDWSVTPQIKIPVISDSQKASLRYFWTMANTYTQLYIQIIFAVSRRECLIPKQNREELHKYITGIVQKQHRDQKMLGIFCMPDHAHMLIGLRPSISISDLVRDIKAGSSKFINDNNWVKKEFNWQEGFGAFSYSRRDLDSVIKYILNQEEHHRKKKFREEYLGILKEFEIEYDEKYLFNWID